MLTTRNPYEAREAGIGQNTREDERAKLTQESCFVEGGHHYRRHLIQKLLSICHSINRSWATYSTTPYDYVQEDRIYTRSHNQHLLHLFIDPGFPGTSGERLSMPRLAAFTSIASARVLRGNADSSRVYTLHLDLFPPATEPNAPFPSPSLRSVCHDVLL